MTHGLLWYARADPRKREELARLRYDSHPTLIPFYETFGRPLDFDFTAIELERIINQLGQDPLLFDAPVLAQRELSYPVNHLEFLRGTIGKGDILAFPIADRFPIPTARGERIQWYLAFEVFFKPGVRFPETLEPYKIDARQLYAPALQNTG